MYCPSREPNFVVRRTGSSAFSAAGTVADRGRRLLRAFRRKQAFAGVYREGMTTDSPKSRRTFTLAPIREKFSSPVTKAIPGEFLRTICLRYFRSQPGLSEEALGSSCHGMTLAFAVIRAVLIGSFQMFGRAEASGERSVPVRQLPERPAGKPCSARRRTPHAGTRVLPGPYPIVASQSALRKDGERCSRTNPINLRKR